MRWRRSYTFVCVITALMIIGVIVREQTRPRPRGFGIPETAVRLPTATPHPPPPADTPVVQVTVDDLLDNPTAYVGTLVEVEGQVYNVNANTVTFSYCDVPGATEIHPLETGPRAGKVPIALRYSERIALYRVRGWFLQGTCRRWEAIWPWDYQHFWYIEQTETVFLREYGR